MFSTDHGLAKPFDVSSFILKQKKETFRLDFVTVYQCTAKRFNIKLLVRNDGFARGSEGGYLSCKTTGKRDSS